MIFSDEPSKASKTRLAIALGGKCLVENPPEAGWNLPAILTENGIELVTLSSLSADFVVFLEYSGAAFRQIRKGIPKARRLLVCFEPRAVHPQQYRRAVRGKFARTLVLSPLQKILSTDKVYTPGFFNSQDRIESRLAKVGPASGGSVGIVNQNKFSFVRGSTYKLRRNSIVEIAAANYDIHVGGRDWNMSFSRQLLLQLKVLVLNVTQRAPLDISKYSWPLPMSATIHLHGAVHSNVDFLSNYEYALVVENDPSYLSEKLFNAILAGCIPLYFGANPELFGIPNSVASITDGLPGSFAKALQNLTNDRKREIFDAGTLWLKDLETQRFWSHQQGVHRLAAEILDFLAVNTPPAKLD